MEDIIPFAKLVFENGYEVPLVQHFYGFGKGAIIECRLCGMNVDDILDSPSIHKSKCEGA